MGVRPGETPDNYRLPSNSMIPIGSPIIRHTYSRATEREFRLLLLLWALVSFPCQSQFAFQAHPSSQKRSPSPELIKLPR